MLNNQVRLIVVTALAPGIWGTTYVVTTQLLPPGQPLLAAVVRALPAGLVLVAVARRLPHGSWWWRAAVLGTFNIGAFFALLFVAAYRLPGGVAATVGAVQPLLVAGLASRLVGERLSTRGLLAAVAGLGGVALLVLNADARLDLVGVAAAFGGACAMATGVVLTKRWGRPAPLLAMTGWQLVAGGLLLAPLALAVEGMPPAALTATNLAGYLYLAVVGSAVAYPLWFRGIQALPVTGVTFLGLLSPLVAAGVGWLVLGQAFSPGQALGGLIVVAALVAAQTGAPNLAPRPASAARSSKLPGARHRLTHRSGTLDRPTQSATQEAPRAR